MQQLKCILGAKVHCKAIAMTFFNCQYPRTTKTRQNYLLMRIIALDHQWDTTTVYNPKVRAQILSQVNKFLYIRIRKGSIANVLQVCRLN